MKRVFKTFILLLTIFMIKQSWVFADSYFGVIVTRDSLSSVGIRSSTNINSSELSRYSTASMIQLVSIATLPDTGSGSSCSSWYEVYVTPIKVGYICSSYIDVIVVKEDGAPAVSACEQEMSNRGFPASYWGGLCYLKEKYPNWIFNAVQLTYDWDYAMSKQLEDGQSLIDTKHEEFLHPTNITTDGPYKSASEMALNFYMDPRRMLSPRRTFQFNSSKYEDNMESVYKDLIRDVSAGMGYYNYHGETFVNGLYSGGKTWGVSPLSLASKIRQELGPSSTGSVYNRYSGVYTEYNNEYYGYYNFFNYGVNTTCNDKYGSSYCALNYAKNTASPAWNSVDAALVGGAKNMYNDYIRTGKYTKYFEKFNVSPTALNPFNYQYMTNIEGQVGESSIMYAALVKENLIVLPFEFSIPVYKNMPSLSGMETSSVKISNVVSAGGYTYMSGGISNIKSLTDASTIKSNLEKYAGAGNVTIFDKNSAPKTSGIIMTGDKIKIKLEEAEETLDVIIKGDTSGDGEVNALDLLQVQKHILGTNKLSGVYQKAGDPSGDGEINALDLLQVQKHILGTYTIN